MSDATIQSEVPEHLLWLADAPLFIDADQVFRFFDAIVRPEAAVAATTFVLTNQHERKLSGTASGEAKVGLSNFLLTVFPFLSAEVKAGVSGTLESNKSKGDSTTVELYPILTPQRQLVRLAIHYASALPDRTFVVPSTDQDWREPATISAVPRAMVFIDLPGFDVAHHSQQPPTRLIPTAAEFDTGKVVPLYSKLVGRNGEKQPRYPATAGSPAELIKARTDYWKWFDENIDERQAMESIERAASKNGRIRWIDYRIRIDESGDCLHLHFSPAGQYDTGVFAYNLVKRGFKHGLRLVGTLKSEPDMNVLAVYEK